jgi:hypothetical protein
LSSSVGNEEDKLMGILARMLGESRDSRRATKGSCVVKNEVQMEAWQIPASAGRCTHCDRMRSRKQIRQVAEIHKLSGI